MEITVLGAAGKMGRELVAQALDEGHTVHALIRTPEGLSARSGLQIFVGDARRMDDLIRASSGTDLVISTLGTGPGKSTLMSEAVAAMIAAARTTGVTRLILVSSYAVGGAKQLGMGAKLLSRTALRHITADKRASEEILKTSDMEWTIVDPTILTNKPKGSGVRELSESETIGLGHTIARADVAAWMLREAISNAHVRRELILSK